MTGTARTDSAARARGRVQRRVRASNQQEGCRMGSWPVPGEWRRGCHLRARDDHRSGPGRKRQGRGRLGQPRQRVDRRNACAVGRRLLLVAMGSTHRRISRRGLSAAIRVRVRGTLIRRGRRSHQATRMDRQRELRPEHRQRDQHDPDSQAAVAAGAAHEDRSLPDRPYAGVDADQARGPCPASPGHGMAGRAAGDRIGVPCGPPTPRHLPARTRRMLDFLVEAFRTPPWQ